METHVDDCVQLVFGSFSRVIEQLVLGANFCSKLTSKLRLVLSPESAVVFSNCKLARDVVKEFARYGIVVKSGTFTRDVGFNFNG